MTKSVGLSVAQQEAWNALELGPLPVGVEPSVALEPVVPGAMPVSSMLWPELEKSVSECTRCSLCSGRRNTVFGVGSRKARWLLIGEAPGEQEDLQGEPFVGPSGQLLDAILRSVGLNREQDVFITNVIKCRPPSNRDPLPNEVSSCSPFLERQIELLEPERMILLGRFATQSVLRTEASIAALRGRPHEVQLGERKINAIVTYHPSYLLRNLEHKNRAWQDWLLAKSL